MPKTPAERQRSLRAKDKAAGVAEVRGIRAPVVLHDKVKKAAKFIIKHNKA